MQGRVTYVGVWEGWRDGGNGWMEGMEKQREVEEAEGCLIPHLPFPMAIIRPFTIHSLHFSTCVMYIGQF